jgi:hypothetical protein
MAPLAPKPRLQKTIQKVPLTGWYYQRFKSKQTFRFDGRSYDYFYHRKNRTWMNERAVEIPIAWHFLQGFGPGRCLEVGNVLSHYYPIKHDVLDKYERAAGVINDDVVDYRPDQPYDAIVSVSTLEHVGWDESPCEPRKTLLALDNMQAMLVPGGRLLVTIPLGYNPDIDMLLERGELCFDQQHYLRRISADNRWCESDWSQIRGARYDHPFLSANALVVGISSKKGSGLFLAN